MAIYTVGHSTRTQEELVALLAAHSVELVGDVRRFPGSRRHPQFNREALERDLPESGIGYEHMPLLGGRRQGSPEVPPELIAGWENESFRNYAAHMQSTEFASGIDALRTEAERKRVAVMCSEALWWRCHRRLVSDALVARGDEVLHIMDGGAERHRLTPFAEVGPDGRVTYPPAQPPLPQPWD